MGVGTGLYMYDVVVEKFTFGISSPDEFLHRLALDAQPTSMYVCPCVCPSDTLLCVNDNYVNTVTNTM